VVLLKPPFRKWVAAFVLLSALILSHTLWLAALGGWLVRTDPPAPADVALVLAGDKSGYRILKAAEMVRQGYTKTVLVSGPEGMYGYNEAELAIPFAVRSGYPPSWFVAAPNQSFSTREEALALIGELHKRGVHTCLLVTSDYHTRRAGGIYRAAAPDVDFRVVGALTPLFDPADWWRTREGRKCFFLEWTKTVTGWFGV
jgi:uncharacterized SAM-binding protein YcdF (DUF218 family)